MITTLAQQHCSILVGTTINNVKHLVSIYIEGDEPQFLFIMFAMNMLNVPTGSNWGSIKSKRGVDLVNVKVNCPSEGNFGLSNRFIGT